MATASIAASVPAPFYDSPVGLSAPGSAATLAVERSSAEIVGPDESSDVRSSDRRDGAPKQTARGIEFAVGTSLNGVAGGRISLLLEDSVLGRPDRVSDNISVRLGDIVTLLSTRMSPALLDRLGSSSAADRYVTLNDLRASGISVSFDDKDRLVFKAM